MIALGSVVVILLDQDRLLAAGVTLNGGVRVLGWVSAQVPPGIDPRDGRAVGAWARGELDRAKIGGSRAVFAAPRGDVVLKRLRLPPGVRDDDLPDMVRLQMARQLTMPAEGAAIDYVAMAQGDVLAAAMPQERLGFLRQVASAARLKIERVGLRASGVAALLAEPSSKRDGPVLAVAPGAASVEFVVMHAGRPVFARCADLGLKELAGTDAAALPERIAVEAKRTWMSYRGGPESAPIEAVLVPGEGSLAREIARRCGESLGIAWELAPLPARVVMPRDMPEAERLKLAPLAGLVGEDMLAEPTLNFASPRRAPDRAAARRRTALLGALAAILVVGSAVVIAKGRLRSLEGRAATAHSKRLALAGEYAAFIKHEARLRHLEQWEKSGVDWVAHAAWLSDLMPDPRAARLDSLSGQLTRGNEVVFSPQGGQYAGGSWGVRHEASITISGPTAQRETANDLRSRLAGSRVYRVDSRGADTARRFSFELTTDQAAPPSPPAVAEGITP